MNNISDFLCDYQWDRYLNLFQQDGFLPLLHAEEDEGKTEEATESRKRKAREEGRVFSTPDLGQGLLILVVMSILWFTSGYLYDSMSSYLGELVFNANKVLLNADIISGVLSRAAKLFLLWFSPVAIASFLVAFLATFVQTNFFISFKLIRFDFKKIVPSFKNLLDKTIFSRSQIINSIKVFIKLSFFVSIIISFFFWFFEDFFSLLKNDLEGSLKKSSFLLFKLLMTLGSFIFIFAIPDWIISRLEYLRKLKMSVQEVKQEAKELEGDPLIKQRQRDRYKQLMNKDIEKNVKESDVIVTNPTHFACALKYDLDLMDAPILQAKGVDFLALRIRKIAKENDIPIVENKPLARMLYDKVSVGDVIPRELYTVVAEILSKITRFR